MKKLLLFLGLLIVAVSIGFGQATPSAQFRVATATTAFGINIPVGSTVYNVATDTYYLCKAPTALDKTLTTASANFTAISNGSHTHVIGDVSHLQDSLSNKYTKAQTNTLLNAKLNVSDTSTKVATRKWTTDNFAAKSHTQAISTITGLQDSLTNKYTKAQADAKLALKINYSDTTTKIASRAYVAQTYAAKTELRYQFVEQYEEPTTGATGTTHSCSYTPLSNTLTVELNGLPLTSSQYTNTNGNVKVNIPVYQYDRVKLSYSYIIGAGVPDMN